MNAATCDLQYIRFGFLQRSLVAMVGWLDYGADTGESTDTRERQGIISTLN